ncbi:MAG: SDR family NAD(P)-dependent oxidoreductase [Candidatus Dormibacteraeota bacterium]|nr:SDR family NAD(P)-dependent oxidoreductase [Candidatus Dormibacteraeota bacterium]
MDQTRITIVGGGTGALGSAVVRRLVADGRKVVVPARRPENAGLPEAVRVLRCDLAVPAEVDAFGVQALSIGPCEALVNCSGGFAAGAASTIDDEVITQQLVVNLLGPWRLARIAARSMIESGIAGRIVTVLSRAAVDVVSNQAGYQVSKAAAARLTLVLARELRERRITVNAVLPSVIDTAANRESMPADHRERWVPVERVAAVIDWLLSPEAGDVSGALLPVYGAA